MAKFLNSTLLLLIVASSLMATNALILPITQVQVQGLLTCSLGASLPTAPPLVNVSVTLSCDGGQTTLGQAVTDLNGFFNIVLSTANSVLFQNSSNCTVYAQLTPALSCEVFPPTAVLQSAVNILGVLIGNVLTIITNVFIVA